MIHVTCAHCGTVYKVEERLLGATGRTVRCTQCSEMWHEDPPVTAEAEPAAPPDWMEEPKGDDLDFRSMVKGDYVNEDTIEIPQSVMPVPADPLPSTFQIPVMTYRPLGMGAAQFGIFVFMALCFVTLSGLFVMKQPVLRHAPAMAHFYSTLGFTVKAPGEGFQLSELVAENRVAGKDRKLVLQAKLANTTAQKMDYPPLLVKLKGAYGGVLKSWEFRPDKTQTLTSGENIPLDLSFKDAPEDGKTVELTILDK
ncbi:MAG: DUF3426 domain-containing protein [bacterium]|nr:DUF3426 domain-containing protein [bacterium]